MSQITRSRTVSVEDFDCMLVLLIAGSAIWYFFTRTPPPPKNLIKLSGRIEGDDTTVSTKIAGRMRVERKDRAE